MTILFQFCNHWIFCLNDPHWQKEMTEGDDSSVGLWMCVYELLMSRLALCREATCSLSVTVWLNGWIMPYHKTKAKFYPQVMRNMITSFCPRVKKNVHMIITLTCFFAFSSSIRGLLTVCHCTIFCCKIIICHKSWIYWNDSFQKCLVRVWRLERGETERQISFVVRGNLLYTCWSVAFLFLSYSSCWMTDLKTELTRKVVSHYESVSMTITQIKQVQQHVAHHRSQDLNYLPLLHMLVWFFPVI